MNQMTTRVKTSQFEQSHLIPALGKAYVAYNKVRVKVSVIFSLRLMQLFILT